MEAGYAYTPPPFLGTSYRQNHQIRLVKNNSWPRIRTHPTVDTHASTSYSSTLLTVASRGFESTALLSVRRRHLRRCYDLLHLCLERRHVHLAARFLGVVIKAHEWSSDLEWQLAMLVLALQPRSPDPHGHFSTSSSDPESHPTYTTPEALAQTQKAASRAASDRKIRFLQSLDLSSTFHFRAFRLTEQLVVELIAANRISDAIELLESRVSMFPYKNNPVLHCYLGMLYFYVGLAPASSSMSTMEQERTLSQQTGRGFEEGHAAIPYSPAGQVPRPSLPGEEEEEAEAAAAAAAAAETSETAREAAAEHVRKQLRRNAREKCRQCFEQTISACDEWTLQELRRRQRIYYMHRKEDQSSHQRMRSRRQRVWGHPLPELARDWPSALLPASAAAGGGVDAEGSADGDQEQERRDMDPHGPDQHGLAGEERRDGEAESPPDGTPAHVQSQDLHYHNNNIDNRNGDEDEDDDEDEEQQTAQEARPTKGPKAWRRVWYQVSEDWTVERPWAWYVAHEFLELLFPARRRVRLRLRMPRPGVGVGFGSENENGHEHEHGQEQGREVDFDGDGNGIHGGRNVELDRELEADKKSNKKRESNDGGRKTKRRRRAGSSERDDSRYMKTRRKRQQDEESDMVDSVRDVIRESTAEPQV
ncbi:hypothetical protein BCV70DRAFT_61467 [Testicularia cyperi]|uniref:Uncharacterized protein n=1 Tax=Testicularia cyperi TaxID=1882483 RepID=A0A317XY90_9BASI|nr:hypothetical protein BCV70DRAFT_61467 [Testicularia cyperi]